MTHHVSFFWLAKPAQFVLFPSGTQHLCWKGSRRTLCGKTIPLDGPVAPVYSERGDLSCARCRRYTDEHQGASP